MHRFILCLSLIAFLGLVGVAIAGASPEPAAAVGCHGATAPASCHGDAAACHGRLTIAQRIAARQTARQDARAAKRAAKASCHGEEIALECECR